MGRLFRVLVLGVITVTLAAACGEEAPKKEPAEVIIKVKTTDAQGQAVPMVLFFINGKKYGITGEDGLVRVPYPAKAGETLVFDVEDPDGYRVPSTTDRSQWKVTVDELGSGPVVIEFPVVFEKPEREYVLLVKIEDGSVPVKVNGQKVGATNAQGDAILKIKGAPGQSFTARAGGAALKGAEFSSTDEVYVLTNANVGSIGKTMSVVAEPPSGGNTATATQAKATPPREVAAATTRTPRARVEREEDLFRPTPVRRRSRPTPVERRPSVAERTPEPKRDRPAKRAERRPQNDPDDIRFGGSSQDAPTARPEPRPAPVVRAAPIVRPTAPKPKPAPADDGLGELLGDDEPEVVRAPPTPPPMPVARPRPQPVAAVQPRSARSRGVADSIGGGLMDDSSSDTVDRSAIDSKVTIGGRSGDSPSALSKEQITARLSDIKGRLKTTRVVDRRDAEFLGQVSAKHPGYYEANRILGDWYYQLKQYKRQAQVLEVATKRGRLKSDPVVLLSLAKAYGKQKNYRRAIRAMNRVERKMRRLSAPLKADAYRFFAEMLEFEFLRQYHDDPKRANTSLIDKAVTRWERYRTFNKGASGSAVRQANDKIEKLKTLKNEMEL